MRTKTKGMGIFWRECDGMHEYIIAFTPDGLALRGRRPTSFNVSSTLQHESSRTRTSSTGDSLISGEVSYTGWMLSTGFGSEFASRCSDVCTKWLLNTCLHTANPSPASLAIATCDRLTVIISISHVWNLLRTEDVYLHTPALRIPAYLRDSSLSLSSF